MKTLKNYWYLIVLSIITIGLAVLVLLTSQKLTSRQPVAPTVPQSTPQAVAPACTLTFSIVTPTPTATGTPGPTPTASPTATNTPTPTATPTITETPPPNITSTSTPTPTEPPLAQASPTPLPTPQVPVSGIGPSVLGISIITIGSLLVLLGLAL